MLTRYSELVMPQDANVVGTLFGGQMVSWMDISAAKAVHRFLKDTKADTALTRAIDAIELKNQFMLAIGLILKPILLK